MNTQWLKAIEANLGSYPFYCLYSLSTISCFSNVSQEWNKSIPRTFCVGIVLFSRKLRFSLEPSTLTIIGTVLWVCKVGEGSTMLRHWLHVCLEACGSSHPEHRNSKLIELRRLATLVKGSFCHRAPNQRWHCNKRGDYWAQPVTAVRI